MLDQNTNLKSTEPKNKSKRFVANIYQSLLRRLYLSAGSPQLKIILWNNIQVSHPVAQYQIKIHNRATLFKLLLHPDFYFGEAYTQGHISINGDLVAILEQIVIGRKKRSTKIFRRLANAIYKFTKHVSRKQKISDIHQRYSLNHKFYERWLDKELMSYTCAYFPNSEYELETAQLAKMDYICRKLELKPGDTVVEAGGGWGGLALYMAKTYGVNVHSYIISPEQIIYARKKCQLVQLDHLVSYVEADYREIVGQFDVFVSLGMIEQIGLNHYAELQQAISRCLKTNGRGLIQSIGRNHADQANAWLNTQMFPATQFPSLQQILNTIGQNHTVLDIENLRLHYAETLSHWLQRFEANVDTFKTQFDNEFTRAWRLYLCGSIASFTTGRLQLFQILFTREQNNEIAWSRDHLYH